MAVGLFIFKGTTSVVTLLSIYYLYDLVNYVSGFLSISQMIEAVKLAYFSHFI